jgi:hypothetical protein
MIFYHGTSKKSGEKILQDGKILTNAPKVYGKGHLIKETTDGYVYLTDKISCAIDYGVNACLLENSKSLSEDIYVFKIEVDKEEVEIDFDEIDVQKCSIPDIESKVVDIETSLEYLCSVRIPRNLLLNDDVKEYFTSPLYGKVVYESKRNKLKNEVIDGMVNWVRI